MASEGCAWLDIEELLQDAADALEVPSILLAARLISNVCTMFVSYLCLNALE